MSYRWLFKGLLVGSLLGSMSEPLLAQNRIRQQSRSRAIATGENSVAASQVRQYATQTGTNPQQRLTIEQYGASHATANGTDNAVITNIDQESHQQGSRYGYGDRSNVQRARINGKATGSSNRIFSDTRQYNWQN